MSIRNMEVGLWDYSPQIKDNGISSSKLIQFRGFLVMSKDSSKMNLFCTFIKTKM